MKKVVSPQSTYCNSFANAIKVLVPYAQSSVPLVDWLNIAASTQWKVLINKGWKEVAQRNSLQLTK
jgi:hypothetical protein